MKAVVALLLGNWKAVVAGVVILAILGFIGNLQLTIARQGRQITGLLEERARSVPAATKAELEAAMKALGTVIDVKVEGLEETIQAIPRGKDTIFIRETSRPGLPGKPGPPGTSLIPPKDQPKAREEAIERILAWFDLGTLVNCDTAGLPPSTVEFLRQPGGRILSTAPCVFRINDEIRLREGPVMVPQRRVFGEAYAGWSLRDATVLGLRARYVLTPGASPSWSVEGSAECRQAAIAFRVPLPSVSCGATDYRLLFVGTF